MIPTLRQLFDEWNRLVTIANSLGITDVHEHTSLHERRADGIRLNAQLYQRIAEAQIAALTAERNAA